MWEGEALCGDCGSAYPVREGIGVFQTPEKRAGNYWGKLEGGLYRYLTENPEIKSALMETPANEMTAADLFFRGLVLEEEGHPLQGRQLMGESIQGIYTADYLACKDRQADFLLEKLKDVRSPVFDLASGKGFIVQRAAEKTDAHIVCTDFSIEVLRSNYRYYSQIGLLDRISLLAVDATQLPLRDGSVACFTNFAGLSNIKEIPAYLAEVGRALSGTFYTIAALYPDDDETNIKAFREYGMTAPTRKSVASAYREAGLHLEIANSCFGKAEPTPLGTILAGAENDHFPVASTTFEWCTLVAS